MEAARDYILECHTVICTGGIHCRNASAQQCSRCMCAVCSRSKCVAEAVKIYDLAKERG